MQQGLFHFSRSVGSIEIFSKYKKAQAIQKIALRQICEKKNLQTLSSMQNFLEIQCLVDDSVDF